MADKINCSVYWIRAKHHTDILTEGYVGITILGVESRWRLHVAASKTDKHPTVLKNAIRKYGESELIVTDILHGSREYCEMMEYKLRPKKYIGWNMTIGGRSPALGAVRSQETRRKISEAHRGRKMTDEQVEANRQRVIKQFTGIEPWEHHYSNKFVWANADVVFEYYLKNPKAGRRTASKCLGDKFPPDSIMKLLTKIKSGWNPSEDNNWLNFSTKYKEENNGTQFT